MSTVNIGTIAAYLKLDMAGFATGVAAAEKGFAGISLAAENHFTRVQRLANTTANSMMVMGGAITAGLLGAEKAAASFQRQMELVHTQAGASQAQVEKLSKSVLALAPAVGTGPEELAKSLYHIVSVGVPASQQMNVLKIAAEGAKVGLASTEETTNALASTMVSGIKGITGAAQAMGILNAVVGAGNMRMSDLNAALGTGILASARTFGLNITDVGAALATLTDAGMHADEASTRLRMSFSLMGAPSKNAAKQLASIGLSSTALADDMRQPNGLLIALQDLKAHLDASGLSASQQAEVISRAFGGGRSGAAIETLLLNMDRLDRKYTQITGTANNFGEAWTRTQQTAAYQTDKLKASVDALVIAAGQDLIPQVNHLVEGLTGLVNKFDQLDAGTRQSIETGAEWAAGIGLVGGAGLKLITILGSAKAAWTALSGGATVAAAATAEEGAAIGGSILLLSGPAGWIAGLVTAMAGLVYAWDHDWFHMNETFENSPLHRNLQSFEDLLARLHLIHPTGGLTQAEKDSLANQNTLDSMGVQAGKGLLSPADKMQTTGPISKFSQVKLDVANSILTDALLKWRPNFFTGPGAPGNLDYPHMREFLGKHDPGFLRAFDKKYPEAAGGTSPAAASGFGVNIVKALAKGVDSPEGRATCALWVSKVLQAAGDAVPNTAGAKALIDSLVKSGAKLVPTRSAAPGDLVVYHGARFGGIQANGQRSGYHVGLYTGGGMVRASNDGRLENEPLMLPGATTTVYRLAAPGVAAKHGKVSGSPLIDADAVKSATDAANDAIYEATHAKLQNEIHQAGQQEKQDLANGVPAAIAKQRYDVTVAKARKDAADALNKKETENEHKYLHAINEALKKRHEQLMADLQLGAQAHAALQQQILDTEAANAEGDPLKEYMAQRHRLMVQMPNGPYAPGYYADRQAQLGSLNRQYQGQALYEWMNALGGRLGAMGALDVMTPSDPGGGYGREGKMRPDEEAYFASIPPPTFADDFLTYAVPPGQRSGKKYNDYGDPASFLQKDVTASIKQSNKEAAAQKKQFDSIATHFSETLSHTLMDALNQDLQKSFKGPIGHLLSGILSDTLGTAVEAALKQAILSSGINSLFGSLGGGIGGLGGLGAVIGAGLGIGSLIGGLFNHGGPSSNVSSSASHSVNVSMGTVNIHDGRSAERVGEAIAWHAMNRMGVIGA